MFSILESEEASLTLVHLISPWPSRRRLGEDGFPSDIFLHSILQSAGPASARACHAPDERLLPDLASAHTLAYTRLHPLLAPPLQD